MEESTINNPLSPSDSDVLTIDVGLEHEATVPASGDTAEPNSAEDEDEDLIEIDNDSAYDDGGDMHSIASTLASFRVDDILQHGHTYHGSASVLLPNDESEQDRLDLQHHILRLCLDGELTATEIPPSAQEIFDVGTGTGIWAIEMGDKFPSAQILGVDISPIQPLWVPPNVMFEIDDITKSWDRTRDSMDFVHVRNMVGSIRDWKGLFAEALEHLKPGGTIEVTEIRTQFECHDGTFEEKGKACKEWAGTFHEIAKGMGMDFDPSPKIPGWLEEVGFEKVHTESRIIPVGPWPKNKRLKHLGAYYLCHMLDGGMENYSMMLFTKAGWDATSVHALLGNVRTELKDPAMHSLTRACFITGRKAL